MKHLKHQKKKKLAHKSKKLKYLQNIRKKHCSSAKTGIMDLQKNASRLSVAISINFHQFQSKGIHHTEMGLQRCTKIIKLQIIYLDLHFFVVLFDGRSILLFNEAAFNYMFDDLQVLAI